MLRTIGGYLSSDQVASRKSSGVPWADVSKRRGSNDGLASSLLSKLLECRNDRLLQTAILLDL